MIWARYMRWQRGFSCLQATPIEEQKHVARNEQIRIENGKGQKGGLQSHPPYEARAATETCPKITFHTLILTALRS
jgi:hypothetical protein